MLLVLLAQQKTVPHATIPDLRACLDGSLLFFASLLFCPVLKLFARAIASASFCTSLRAVVFMIGESLQLRAARCRGIYL